MIMLRIVFFAQLTIMLPAFVSMIATQASFGSLALLFYLLLPGAAIMLYGLWQFFRYPDRRRLAFATAATPLVCLGGPVLFHNLHDGPLPPAILIPAIAIVIAIAIYTLLGRTDQWRGAGLFTNRLLNRNYLLSLLLVLALLWLPAIVWLGWRDAIALPKNIAERDVFIRIIGYYFIGVAAPATCLSLFGMFYAPVGIFRSAGGRLLHVGQLLLSLLVLLTLAVLIIVAWLGAVNPG
jgi:hypothetical protein